MCGADVVFEAAIAARGGPDGDVENSYGYSVTIGKLAEPSKVARADSLEARGA